MERFRSEEMTRSQIMYTMHMLADRYALRVTGTPNHESAATWALADITRWTTLSSPNFCEEGAWEWVTARDFPTALSEAFEDAILRAGWRKGRG